jgi:ribosomal protein L10
MLFDAKFPMKIQQQVNTSVMQYALGGTRWAPVLPLCVSKVALGFCSDTNVPKLLKLLKKMPQFLLLGLVYDNRLLHKDDVERVAKMTSLLGTQSQLSSTLNLPGMTLSQNLTAGQIALSHSLSSLTKDLAQNESSSSDSSDSSSSSKDSD